MFINRHGTIGEIMTFFIAFIIIFFLMILLLVVSNAIAGEKNLPFVGKGKNEISFKRGFYSGELSNILESQIKVDGKFISVKELILLWNSDKEKYKTILENKVENVLTSFEYEYIDANTENLRKRGFALNIYGKKNLIESKNFNLGFGIKDISGRALHSLNFPFFVSQSEKINITLLGSEEAVKK